MADNYCPHGLPYWLSDGSHVARCTLGVNHGGEEHEGVVGDHKETWPV